MRTCVQISLDQHGPRAQSVLCHIHVTHFPDNGNGHAAGKRQGWDSNQETFSSAEQRGTEEEKAIFQMTYYREYETRQDVSEDIPRGQEGRTAWVKGRLRWTQKRTHSWEGQEEMTMREAVVRTAAARWEDAKVLTWFKGHTAASATPSPAPPTVVLNPWVSTPCS